MTRRTNETTNRQQTSTLQRDNKPQTLMRIENTKPIRFCKITTPTKLNLPLKHKRPLKTKRDKSTNHIRNRATLRSYAKQLTKRNKERERERE